VLSVAYPDGKTLASGSQDHVKLWDVATGKSRPPSRDTFYVTSVAFSGRQDTGLGQFGRQYQAVGRDDGQPGG
jgi:WD40 repeat protein